MTSARALMRVRGMDTEEARRNVAATLRTVAGVIDVEHGDSEQMSVSSPAWSEGGEDTLPPLAGTESKPAR